MIREILAVGIGGGLGSIGRYLLCYGVFASQTLLGFPVGTFAVNAAGSLLIGLVLGYAPSTTAVWLLAVGFCGGFTTFSSFSVDALRLLKEGCYGPALYYVALSLAICIACAALGMWIGQFIKN